MFFMAMQPGALMLSGRDLVGALPLEHFVSENIHSEKMLRRYEAKRSNASGIGAGGRKPAVKRQAQAQNVVRRLNPNAVRNKRDNRATAGPASYILLNDAWPAMVNAAGLPVAETLYGPLDEQAVDPESFLHGIGKILRLRENLGLARAELVGRLETRGKGVLGLVLQSENEGFVICLSNFSRTASREKLHPGKIAGLAGALSKGRATVVYGNLPECNLDARALEFTLPGWEGAVIAVEPKKYPY
jgi:hypothetical protein